MVEIKLVKKAKFAGDVYNALLKAGWSSETASSFCDAIPDADCTEVVRCKECKYSEIWGLEKSLGGDPRDTRVCLYGNSTEWTRDDDFCSCGERRSNEKG